MDFTKSGFGFRNRKKSKYLLDPYTSIEQNEKGEVKEVEASVPKLQNVETDSKRCSGKSKHSSSAPQTSQNMSLLPSEEENVGEKTKKEELVPKASNQEQHVSLEKLVENNSITDHNLTVNNANRMEDNGESLKTCLLLQFAPGSYIPSQQDLMITFLGFGPLKASETRFLKDTTCALVVFMRSEDAAAAFQGLEQDKFGLCSSLVDYKLLSNGSVEMPSVTPTQPPVSRAMTPATTPSLQYIKHNSQMMLSMLESSGNSICPNMKATLDDNIKNLLKKVNFRLGHTSP